MSKYTSNKYVNSVKPCFSYREIEFLGGSKSWLESNETFFKEGDLVINCTGREIYGKHKSPSSPFKKLPNFLKFLENRFHCHVPHEIVLDWKDMSPPPVPPRFWEELHHEIFEGGHDIKRVIVCCAAGLGRTGTSLAALYLLCACEIRDDEKEDPVEFVRKAYRKRAVETSGQERYIDRAIEEYWGPEWLLKLTEEEEVDEQDDEWDRLDQFLLEENEQESDEWEDDDDGATIEDVVDRFNKSHWHNEI